MGIDLAALAANTETVPFMYGGETATATFRPSVMTTDAVQKFTADSASEDEFLDFISGLLTDWDVTDGGVKVPIDRASLGAIPLGLLRAIVQAIMGGMDTSPEASRTSGAS